MPRIFVPVLSDIGDLFEVAVVYDEDLSVNGFYYHSDYDNVDPLLDKIKSAFDVNLQARIKVRNENKKLKTFDSSTVSVNLGIYIALYSFVFHRELKKKYNSITLTGDFSVDKDSILLKSVSEIQKKFEIIKQNMIMSSGKHLFIYVSDDEKVPVPEGWHDNLFVVALSSKDKIKCVFAEVFELKDFQKRIIKAISIGKCQNEYIENPKFIGWKKTIAENECSGFVIQGKSNGGKTAAALGLCKYLVATSLVDELLWITIHDNKRFWNKITKMDEDAFFFDKSEIIKGEFPDEFSSLDEFLSQKKKVCFVVDNIEGDFVDEIISFINNNYREFVLSGFIKLIVTTWFQAKNIALQKELGLLDAFVEELKIDRVEFEHVVYSVLDNYGVGSLFFESSDVKKQKLLTLLYEQCLDDGKILPGYVLPALAPLREIGVSKLISRFERKDIKKLSPIDRIIKIDFEVLDLLSQLVLFACLGLDNYWHELDVKQIRNMLNEKITNDRFSACFLISEKNIVDSMKKLVDKNLLWTDKKNVFYAKKDVVEFCIFSTPNDGKISKGLAAARDFLIPSDVKIDFAIRYGLYENFMRLLKDFAVGEEINQFFIHCIEYGKGIEYLEPLIKKGASPSYKDMHGDTAIDAYWCDPNPKLKVLDYLLDNGFKPRTKIPCIDRSGNRYECSPLFLSLNNCCVPLVRRILKMHLFDDINEYEFNENYTYLQFCVGVGSSVDVVDLLIKAGADPFLKTKDGYSLAILAVLNDEHPEILKYLIDNDLCGDLSFRDKKGRTALDHAKKSKCKIMTEIILEGVKDNS